MFEIDENIQTWNVGSLILYYNVVRLCSLITPIIHHTLNAIEHVDQIRCSWSKRWPWITLHITHRIEKAGDNWIHLILVPYWSWWWDHDGGWLKHQSDIRTLNYLCRIHICSGIVVKALELRSTLPGGNQPWWVPGATDPMLDWRL